MPVEIKYSVGKGGMNIKQDVRTIQSVLDKLYPSLSLEVNGISDEKLIRRIIRFQKRVNFIGNRSRLNVFCLLLSCTVDLSINAIYLQGDGYG